jgi:putative nucleotidyltransferase with HDIG domain
VRKDSVLIKPLSLESEFRRLNTDITALKRKLKKMRSKPPSGKTGRARVDLLNDLAMALYRSKPLMTEAYAKEAMVLSERTGYREGKARSNQLMGISKGSRGKYYESMKYFNTAREIFTELDDKNGIATTFSNIGIVYSYQSRFDLAIDQHLKALAIFEEIDKKIHIAHSLNNIGIIFRKRHNLEKAEEYYMKALRIREETGDQSGLAMSLNNMGILAKERGDLESALDYNSRSLNLKEELGDKHGISVSYSNIGDIHMELEEYTPALEYYRKSLSITEELENEKGISNNCKLIGHIMILLKKYDEALEYLERALRISIGIGARVYESDCYKELSDLYKATGDYEKAFLHYKKHSILTQEIFSDKSTKTIAGLQIRYETEQKEKEAELYYLRNVELCREINDRKIVESQLVAHERLLEERVKDRTIELQKSMRNLKKSVKGTIHTLSRIIESKDPYTSGHQLRVAELARLIAIELGFDENNVEAVFMISLVHDIGKISIPQEILSRPGQLSKLEQEIVQTHSQIGYEILSEVEFPWPVADVILQHQELYNGSGYPNGLKGEDILIEARIIAVADVVEAMTSHRPYRSIPGLERAIEEITLNSGILYDPDVVKACRRVICEKGFNFQ